MAELFESLSPPPPVINPNFSASNFILLGDVLLLHKCDEAVSVKTDGGPALSSSSVYSSIKKSDVVVRLFSMSAMVGGALLPNPS